MKNRLLELFKKHGYGELFELTLSIGEASEILLQQHSNNRLLDDSVIKLWAASINSGDFLEAQALPIVINANGFDLIEGAHKLAGFVESDLNVITFQAIFRDVSL